MLARLENSRHKGSNDHCSAETETMCDDEINPGIIEDWSVTRRSFGFLTAAAAAGAAGATRAATAVTEKNVEIKTPDGAADAALFYPQGRGSWPAVLMWPDIMTLRPVFREMGKRLAAEGYVVLVPNFYYRGGKAPAGGFNFSTDEGRAAIAPLRATLNEAAIDRDAAAFIAFLDAQPQTNKARKAGVQGYCMGGPFAFRTAAALPDRIGAVASFHGGGLVSAQPTSPHLLIPKTKAEYLVAIAANDDQRSPDDKTKLKAALDAAGRPNKVEVYAGANHGWTVPGSAAYNEPQAEKAWAELLAMYKRALV
jgi:carboxymethylenebutenolidase